MQSENEFKTLPSTLICPECSSLFASEVLLRVPPLTAHSPVDTDLHRVLPQPALRAALVAWCPACDFCWWAQAFAAHGLAPDLVPQSPDVEHARKFVRAVQTGRQKEAQSLDLALLALNGCWCAREEGKTEEQWLELARSEMERALNDTKWQGNRPYYSYIMGEICRQLGEFDTALEYYGKAAPQLKTPAELIERQKIQAKAGNAGPLLLPPHLVEQIFCRAVPQEAAA